MEISFLSERFIEHQDDDAIIWRDKVSTYEDLLTAISKWRELLEKNPVPIGSVVAVKGDFSPSSIALLLALIERGCVFVPLTESVKTHEAEFLEIAQVEYVVSFNRDDEPQIVSLDRKVRNELLLELRAQGRPGLILFSSGSTGHPKAAVHDFGKLLNKFERKGKKKRILTFLLFDHIGGVNTLLHVLSSGGCVVVAADRTPQGVAKAIETHRVQILPTSPTFLNLLVLSEAHKQYKCNSLELITYGTEVMPESTLERLRTLFRRVQLKQTYGLSEVGILRSESRSSDSLWVRVGGEGYQTRIVDNMLEIKSESAMLGYLNAPSPFTKDGWFITGDAVEQDGEFIKILGRKSEIINVGGEKLYPAEVESVLQELANVEEVIVSAEANAITGQMVVASVKLKAPEDKSAFRRRMRSHCRSKLQNFKIPQKVHFLDESYCGGRFKKMRGRVPSGIRESSTPR